jgi:hypothetical protein
VDCFATKEDFKWSIDQNSTSSTDRLHNRDTNTLESIPLLFQISFSFNAYCADTESGPPVDFFEEYTIHEFY